MENTLVILKPDCMGKNLYGTVLKRFEEVGLRVIACKMMELGSEILREHYAHHATKPYFPEIEAFMSSGPVLVVALQGKDAIVGVRKLLGATDPAEAEEGTLRKLFGESKMKNIAHASDSLESAEAEIRRFFKVGEVFEAVEV